VGKVCDIKYCVTIYTVLLWFNFPYVTFPSMFQFLIIFGTGFEVLTVVRIRNVVWVRTPYGLVHNMVMNVLEQLSGSFYTGHHDGSSRCRPNRLCWPFTLHGPITEKTTISHLNIIHFSCMSLCHKNICTHIRQYTALLFYIILLSEQQCVAGNIITNCTVYCLMNVCSCFVMVLKFYIFSAVTHSRRGVIVARRVATLPMSYYIAQTIYIQTCNSMET